MEPLTVNSVTQPHLVRTQVTRTRTLDMDHPGDRTQVMEPSLRDRATLVTSEMSSLLLEWSLSPSSEMVILEIQQKAGALLTGWCTIYIHGHN